MLPSKNYDYTTTFAQIVRHDVLNVIPRAQKPGYGRVLALLRRVGRRRAPPKLAKRDRLDLREQSKSYRMLFDFLDT